MLWILAIFCLIRSTGAQDFGGEPSCAVPCFSSAYSIAGCALTDKACQCGTGQAAIQTAVTPCLLTACNAVNLGIAASVGLNYCSSYSASLVGVGVTTSETSALISSSTKSASAVSSTSPSTVPSTTSSTRLQQNTAIATSVTTSETLTLISSSTKSVSAVSSSPSTVSSTTSSTSSQQTMTIVTAVSSNVGKSLSAGTSAGIGVGAALGSLIFIGSIILAFWYRRRSAMRKSKDNNNDDGEAMGKAELGADSIRKGGLNKQITEVENDELEKWRTAELQGRGIVPIEIGGNERFELEARRKAVNEIGL